MRTDGGDANRLPTCSTVIKALMVTYGVWDVRPVLIPGTKGLCNRQVSLLCSFKSSLYPHYVQLKGRCSDASAFRPGGSHGNGVSAAAAVLSALFFFVSFKLPPDLLFVSYL